MTMWPVSASSSARGTVVEKASSRNGDAIAGRAPIRSTIPSRSITTTKAFICGLSHGESPPKPVVVNISTVNCSDSRSVLGRFSNTRIPHW